MAPARPCTGSGPVPQAPGRTTGEGAPLGELGLLWVEGETSGVSLRKQLAQGAAGMSVGGAPEQKEPRGSHVT